MVTHLPVLIVVAPLLAAPLVAIMRGGRWPWTIATLVTWFSFLCSALLLAHVSTYGVFSYALGGWEAPWGIEYRVDFANALLLLLITGLASVIVPYARLSVAQ